MIAHILLTSSLVALAALFGAALYESIVIAPNLSRDAPASLEAASRFFVRIHAGHLFRVLSPLTQLLLIASVIASWRMPDVRLPAVAALAASVLCDSITFTFHYPRLAIMFRGKGPQDAESRRRAAREWGIGNHVRVLLLLFAFFAALRGVVVTATH